MVFVIDLKERRFEYEKSFRGPALLGLNLQRLHLSGNRHVGWLFSPGNLQARLDTGLSHVDEPRPE